jgi:hypothetical protein
METIALFATEKGRSPVALLIISTGPNTINLKQLLRKFPTRQLDTGRAEKLPERVNCANRYRDTKSRRRLSCCGF